MLRRTAKAGLSIGTGGKVDLEMVVGGVVTLGRATAGAAFGFGFLKLLIYRGKEGDGECCG